MTWSPADSIKFPCCEELLSWDYQMEVGGILIAALEFKNPRCQFVASSSLGWGHIDAIRQIFHLDAVILFLGNPASKVAARLHPRA